jgi:hypothetical protein
VCSSFIWKGNKSWHSVFSISLRMEVIPGRERIVSKETLGGCRAGLGECSPLFTFACFTLWREQARFHSELCSVRPLPELGSRWHRQYWEGFSDSSRSDKVSGQNWLEIDSKTTGR